MNIVEQNNKYFATSLNKGVNYHYKEKNNNIILDLSVRSPFEEEPSIPVDTRTASNRTEKFIDNVKDQRFLVFMREAKEYFSGKELKATEIENPIIRARLEAELNFKIAVEKSGIDLKDINTSNDINKKDIDINYLSNEKNSNFDENGEIKVPIERLFIKFEFKK